MVATADDGFDESIEVGSVLLGDKSGRVAGRESLRLDVLEGLGNVPDLGHLRAEVGDGLDGCPSDLTSLARQVATTDTPRGVARTTLSPSLLLPLPEGGGLRLDPRPDDPDPESRSCR